MSKDQRRANQTRPSFRGNERCGAERSNRVADPPDLLDPPLTDDEGREERPSATTVSPQRQMARCF